MSAIIIDKEVNCIGMICPLPVLRTKKALSDMQTGKILKVIANDPGAKHDIPMFAKQTGNNLIHSEVEDENFIFYLARR
ncbi:sulfurtransferase TusA family protein [Polynucleobacter rarus]|jgi:tRNA 2-thiouridine synthesizing protein A|uniref:sulfurtransferase TusA family protein n=1 Tax=Polynucleobacter rarus TaxID=556055 RepID=UPI003CCC374F